MTPLRKRMVDDMTVRGLSENTRKSYLSAVSGLARHYGRSPDCIEAREVQDYLIFLYEKRGLTWKSCKTIRHDTDGRRASADHRRAAPDLATLHAARRGSPTATGSTQTAFVGAAVTEKLDLDESPTPFPSGTL